MFDFSSESSSLSGSEKLYNLFGCQCINLLWSITSESIFLKSFLFFLYSGHQIINIMVNNIYQYIKFLFFKHKHQDIFSNNQQQKLSQFRYYFKQLITLINIDIFAKINNINKDRYNINTENIKMREKIQPGSPSLFFFIQCVNTLFGVSALVLIGLSIWLWNEFNTFTIIQIIFLTLGVAQFLLTLLVISAKKSVAKLRCFLFFMMILFLAQLISVIVIAAVGDSIVKQIANDSAQQIDKLNGYLNIVIIFSGFCLAVIAVQILFVKCYIGSLRERNHQFDYKFLDNQGRKLTLGEKQQKDKNQIEEKYNKKRQEMAKKYPGFKANS